MTIIKKQEKQNDEDMCDLLLLWNVQNVIQMPLENVPKKS